VKLSTGGLQVLLLDTYTFCDTQSAGLKWFSFALTNETEGITAPSSLAS